MKENTEKKENLPQKRAIKAHENPQEPQQAPPPAVATAETPHSTPESKPAAPEPDSAQANIEAAVAEAEQRGYLRGRNERIEQLMQRPAMMERPDTTELHPASTRSDQGFLSKLKVSIWDR